MADVGLAEDEAAGGEVGALDVLEDEVEVGAGLGFFFGDEGDAGVDDFGEVVRRDVGGHADGDAGDAVDDEVGDARGQDGGLEGGLVVVGGEVDGVGVDVGEHFAGDAGEAGLGVTHGGGWVAVDGAEVALAVDHGVAQGEGLGEADHGVVDGGVAVGMVVAHDVADDLGGLGVLLVELEAHLLHAVEDAAVDGLEAVADVGQGAADDDRHGVVEVGAAHLVFNVDGKRKAAPRPWTLSPGGPSGGLPAGGGLLELASCGEGIVFGVFREEFVSHVYSSIIKVLAVQMGRWERVESEQKGCSEEHPFCLVDVGLEGELEVQLHGASVVGEYLLRLIEERELPTVWKL